MSTRLRIRAFTLVELPAVSRRERGAFTLVELLVVIGIIAVLMSILIPAISKAHAQAKLTQCASNQRQALIGLLMYMNDYKGWVPPGSVILPNGSVLPGYESGASKSFAIDQTMRLNGGDPGADGGRVNLGALYPKYVKTAKVFFCPAGLDPLPDGSLNFIFSVEGYQIPNLIYGTNSIVSGTRYAWSHYEFRSRITFNDRLIKSRDGSKRFTFTDMFHDGGVRRPWHKNGYNIAYYDGHVKWLPDPYPLDPVRGLFVDQAGGDYTVQYLKFMDAADKNF